MKVCVKCKLEKSLDEFGNNKTKVDGKQTCCKLCVKEINAVYYKRTPEKNPARVASRMKARLLAQQFVWDYMTLNPCVDCPETDPVVLTFDHVRGTKSFDISYAVMSGYGISTIQQEIAKCEVRCANCHTRVTASRANWYSMINTGR